jgi:hypothetical protein
VVRHILLGVVSCFAPKFDALSYVGHRREVLGFIYNGYKL